jgi:diacylglycerol kinase (ATP)
MTKNESGKIFSIADRVQSVRYAVNGIVYMLKTQHNAWLHLAITLAVFIVGWRLHIRPEDWRWLIVAIVLVWFAEAMNTAFEFVCDIVSPEFHLSVEKAKDIAAGGVLLCAAGAVVLGLITFIPYVTN